VSPAELTLSHQLRSALNSQDRRQGMQQFFGQLRSTTTNAEFLRQISRF
jgi:transcription termination factor Rho